MPEGAVDPLDGGPLGVGAHEMPVGVQRQLRGPVTEPDRDGLDVHAGRDPQAGSRVPEVVRPAAVGRLVPPNSAPPVLGVQVSILAGREEQLVGAQSLKTCLDNGRARESSGTIRLRPLLVLVRSITLPVRPD